MWVVRFTFNGSGVFFGKGAKQCNLNLTGYPISSFEKNNTFFVNIVGTIKGEEKNKKEFADYLKNSKYVKKFEIKNDFLIGFIKEDYIFKPFYSPSFIYLSPVFIDNKGTYYYHLGCWERKEIEKLLNHAEKYPNYELITLEQEDIENVSITGIQPDLTKKQKHAYELAVKNGYYKYPKQTELKDLAKLSGISYSTFQQHLKYAEKKISSFFVGKY